MQLINRQTFMRHFAALPQNMKRNFLIPSFRLRRDREITLQLLFGGTGGDWFQFVGADLERTEFHREISI